MMKSKQRFTIDERIQFGIVDINTTKTVEYVKKRVQEELAERLAGFMTSFRIWSRTLQFVDVKASMVNGKIVILDLTYSVKGQEGQNYYFDVRLNADVVPNGYQFTSEKILFKE